jgi:hypothetical protein
MIGGWHWRGRSGGGEGHPSQEAKVVVAQMDPAEIMRSGQGQEGCGRQPRRDRPPVQRLTIDDIEALVLSLLDWEGGRNVIEPSGFTHCIDRFGALFIGGICPTAKRSPGRPGDFTRARCHARYAAYWSG